MYSKHIVSTIDTGSNTETRIPSVVDLPIQFSYTDFTTIDQRLKYYVQEKFFWENEEFVLVFRVCLLFYLLEIKLKLFNLFLLNSATV